MDKNEIINKLFTQDEETKSVTPFNKYVEDERAGTQAVLAEATLDWVFSQFKLNKEDLAKRKSIKDIITLAGVFNKSQLDQTLDKAGIIERSKGSKGSGRSVDTSELTF